MYWAWCPCRQAAEYPQRPGHVPGVAPVDCFEVGLSGFAPELVSWFLVQSEF